MKHKKTSNIGLYGMYTVLFCLISLVVFLPFIVQGKSFVSNFDAISQHYVSIVKLKEMIKSVIAHPSHFGQFWDWTIGLGGDQFQTFSYYSVGDIFIYPFLVFKNAEHTYTAMMLTKLFCSGIAMILFLDGKKQYRQSTLLIVSLFYVFCGFSIHSVTSHPMFLTPMVLFPLILLSIDRFVDGKGRVMFPLLVAIVLVSNFYFGFLVGLGAIYYYAVQQLSKPEVPFKQKLINSMKIIPYGILGLGLSSIVLIPTIYFFMHSTRASVPFSNGLVLFPLNYYMDFFYRFITSPMPKSFEYYGGYGVIAIPAILFSMSRFKTYKKLNITLLIGIMCWLTPYLASIINGFASPSVRWSFLMATLFSVMIANFVEHIFELNTVEIKRLLVGSVIFSVIALIGANVLIYHNMPAMIPVILLFILLSVIVFSNSQSDPKQTRVLVLIVCIVAINGAYLGNYYHSSFGGNYAENHKDKGQVNAFYQNYFDGMNRDIPKESSEFHRESFGKNYKDNFASRVNIGSMIGQPMINSYYSLQNESVGEFAQAMDFSDWVLAEPIKYLDNRHIASQFLGVKYVYGKNGSLVPVGYNESIGKENNPTTIYETDYNFPLAYTQNQVINEKDIKSLSGIEKEELLSKAAVSNTQKSTTTLKQLNTNTKEVPIKFKKVGRNYSIDVVNKEILAEKMEFYLKLDGIKIEDLPLKERVSNFKHNKNQSKSTFLKEQIDYEPSGTFLTATKNKEALNSYYSYSPTNISSYNPKESVTMNLGVLDPKEELNDINVEISGNQTVSVANITLISRPLSTTYETEVKAIQSHQLNELEVSNNKITARTQDVDNNELLVTSIPYSEGWTLRVDEKLTPLMKVNYGFLGAVLTEGTHQLELTYRTPKLMLGVLISCMSILGLVGIILLIKVKG